MKRVWNLILTLFMIATLFSPTALASNAVSAKATSSQMTLDGQPLQIPGFNIKGNNYFKLRHLANALSGTSSQFDVIWNGEKNAVEIITEKPYTPLGADDVIPINDRNRTIHRSAYPTKSDIYIDGKLVDITAYNIENSNYFRLRDLGELIPYDVDYDAATDHIILSSRTADKAYRAEKAFTSFNNMVHTAYPRWSHPVTSHLIDNNDGTLSVLRVNEHMTIETYNSEFELIAHKEISRELPLFGGFYSGESYHYIAYGQENREEDDDKEVIRLVRYDKDFNRIDSVSINGGESYTTVPFQAGSGRIAEHDNTLVFHTARLRYATEDGLNHQSQLTIIVDTATMTVKNYLGRFQANHVSHSFDQYALFDDDLHVLLDHGDAYPRSIVLSKEDNDSYNETTYITVDMFDIPGEIGANVTGVSIGGFEMSDSSYIVAMNTIDHSKVSEYTHFSMIGLDVDQRDIILAIVPKHDLNDSAVKQITLASYVDTDKLASIPKLVKINDDKFIVLWQEFDMLGEDMERKIGDLKYVYIDHEGTIIGDIQTRNQFMLSNTQPIVVDNKIIWFVDDHSFSDVDVNSQSRMFYKISF